MTLLEEGYQKIRELAGDFKGLGLSKACNDIRHALTILITNPEVMSDQIASKMLPSSKGVPYHIDSSDPEQIVVLKK
ncbi:hypothetical protein [Legionella tunisiensis]|uniref:hypothetical protein n=1 Tax=Legionella tunisiensis TaxID=1034944 RepID=UPI0003084549|nr:hypothetical protein [Legionella tunisiensis]